MSFDTLQPAPKAAKATDPVRIGVLAAQRGSRLMIILSASFVDKIDPKKHRTFKLELGSGEDRHVLRLTPDQNGLFTASAVGPETGRERAWRVNAPPHERWPRCRIKTQAVTHEASAGGVVKITLPAWAWEAKAKEQAEKLAGLVAAK